MCPVLVSSAGISLILILDDENQLVLTKREILQNLQTIVMIRVPMHEVACNSIDVLSTENCKLWLSLHHQLSKNGNNDSCLQIIDNVLFIVCLDDVTLENLAELCNNFLCGIYNLKNGVQVGTCTNQWCNKLRIIMCADGYAGTNFEHTGIDGHTILRRTSTGGPTVAPQLRYVIDTIPKKLEWALYPELHPAIRFTENHLSDLICQNDCQALKFKGYGKNFIVSHGISLDVFVWMAFQAAYYRLYGCIECTYERAMMKHFLHSHTKAIRTVQSHSVNFIKTFFSEHEVIREEDEAPSLPSGSMSSLTSTGSERPALPSIFTNPGWSTLVMSILSTSNCGNPALQLFGFRPIAAEGYGIGYLIKNEGISICALSRHLQMRQFLDMLERYLLEVQQMLIQLHLSMNPRPEPFVDHVGVLHDSKMGQPMKGQVTGYEKYDDGNIMRTFVLSSRCGVRVADGMSLPAGYPFFDSVDVELLGRRKQMPKYYNTGRIIPLAEY
ncbi:CoA-dependent acyltransferase [Laetiporus sulphureus 93-53]|uniref:CoA-dependent acyltransferase n=1 Tax=Laetiporus sulphureus 93-53 TaxID=1314785 RepID=A0A165DCJ1_9APHY|nr:CoA-dependent acyltransferase [Laetiporus sulphureus 93-53]KZT04563.1 CoA-dependent acyltransferase [Laetiporus sulphureus 93-53]